MYLYVCVYLYTDVSMYTCRLFPLARRSEEVDGFDGISSEASNKQRRGTMMVITNSHCVCEVHVQVVGKKFFGEENVAFGACGIGE